MNSSNSEDFYKLEGEELEFFQDLTKIKDKDDLRAHIVAVQRKAFEAVIDGWPADSVIASDLRQEFWNYGHELFRSTPETFPANFVSGDVFNPTMLAPRGPFINNSEIFNILSSPTPALPDLTNLTPLQGRISAIHTSSFFDIFSEEEQHRLARVIASLLRPEAGSVIFGQHSARPEKGFRKRWRGPATDANSMFCHSPESWKELWLKGVFGEYDGKGEDRIKVDVELAQIERNDLLDGNEQILAILKHQ
ncbi:hypothetical protein D9619_011098 [Psilocybe cf. subviscida]|uniref:Uncharacterized protein n=1 Tax=Psilocybe cf. subviscida TaxID=2480587 RepID=A0A8H5BJS4_9AGAR|nr:hypothetical protein D9619_011098 [Psilocybe cf. subviscida]